MKNERNSMKMGSEHLGSTSEQMKGTGKLHQKNQALKLHKMRAGDRDGGGGDVSQAGLSGMSLRHVSPSCIQATYGAGIFIW